MGTRKVRFGSGSYFERQDDLKGKEDRVIDTGGGSYNEFVRGDCINFVDGDFVPPNEQPVDMDEDKDWYTIDL